ncbi:hypothetical protein C7974DRAFT_374420 [Boeremia exigua]|uniref:uncharacterized protein n=1 Tax=Boeremia exigua TaxID=749465 RepID=UPI001E8CDF46|nr:uncharacterized protein C7974DRAFT_374420 [Boeremia exigua]KAH6637778.1 hypothetical protein C7974DRAFT_374420 [Boeremia exigua]
MNDNFFCRCLTGPIVKIIVGRRRSNDRKDSNDETDDKSSNYSDVADKHTIEQQTFYVHKELLIAKSSLFAKTLSGDDTNSSSSTTSSNSAWLKDEIGVLNLPEDDPEIVAKYLSLLYNGDSLAQQCSTIVSKSDISEETTKAKIVELFTRLCKLYVFCEKVQDISMKHNLLAAFVRVTTTPRQDGSLYALGSEFINILYAGTVKHDPVRKYLQDCAVRNKQDVWIEDVAKYNTEYLMDVEAAMYRYRPFSSTDWYRKVLEISRHLEKQKRSGSDDNGEATKSS